MTTKSGERLTIGGVLQASHAFFVGPTPDLPVCVFARDGNALLHVTGVCVLQNQPGVEGRRLVLLVEGESLGEDL